MNNNESDQLFEIAKNYYESTSENVIGVGYGYKTVNGKMTDEKCMVFSVEKKLPIDEIDKNDIIPSTISISPDKSIKTDVVETEYAFLSCSSFSTWQNTPPPNRNKIRPLQGGISAINGTSLGDYAGTLGFIARDDQDGCLVGVSNNHVLIDDAFICSERGGGVQTNVVYNEVVQPSEFNVDFENSIGHVKRYFPIKSGLNYVDGALCTLKKTEISDSVSYKQYGLAIDDFLPFATSQEIDSLIDNSFDLFSSGRTTGAKGEGSVKLKISQVNSIINIKYKKQGIATTLQFGKCLHFIATTNNTKPYSQVCDFPIAGGDSGSALIANIDGTKKIIGLVFAGSIQGGVCIEGIANRIDEVAAKLCISAWEGGSSKVNSNKIKAFTTNSYSDKPCLEYNGEKYWQLGFYNSGIHNFDNSIFDENQPRISGALSGCACPVLNGGGGGQEPPPDDGGGGQEPPPGGGGGGQEPPPGGGGGGGGESPDGGVGGRGDVHFTWGHQYGGKNAPLVFYDDNYAAMGSHWAIDWLEISKNDQVSAILNRRSMSNLHENTSVHSNTYIYGNPQCLNWNSRYANNVYMGEFDFDINFNKISGMKYVGGLAVEFYRQTVREGKISNSRNYNIGRGVSFSPNGRFRIADEVSGNDATMVYNSNNLRSKFEQYVSTLTGITGLNGQIDNEFSLFSTASPTGRYPMLVSPSQMYLLSSGLKYIDPFASGTANCVPCKYIYTDQNNNMQTGFMNPQQVVNSWQRERSLAIQQRLAIPAINCKKCIDPASIRAKDGDIYLCDSDDNPDHYWKYEFKYQGAIEIDMTNLNGTGLPRSNVKDCRTCGTGALESFFWSGNPMCGRQDSDCLPLGLVLNGQVTGYNEYGAHNKIVPYYANNSGIDFAQTSEIGFGPMYENFQVKQYPYVINGKLITGNMDPRYFYTWSGDIPLNSPLIASGWTGYNPSGYGNQPVWTGEYSQLLYVTTGESGYAGRIFFINDTFRR